MPTSTDSRRVTTTWSIILLNRATRLGKLAHVLLATTSCGAERLCDPAHYPIRYRSSGSNDDETAIRSHRHRHPLIGSEWDYAQDHGHSALHKFVDEKTRVNRGWSIPIRNM